VRAGKKNKRGQKKQQGISHNKLELCNLYLSGCFATETQKKNFSVSAASFNS
jgi:hypothetical protein